MNRLTENRIVLVSAPTRLEDLIVRFNSQSQARFYIEHLGADFSDYRREHDTYHLALTTARRALGALGRLQELERKFLPGYIFGPDDLVVALGRDGLVANTLKYLNAQSLIGVNPDPARWDGVLLPFAPDALYDAVRALFTGGRSVREVTMARVRLTDGQTLLAVNDFFIGQKTHVSARYELRQGDRRETQSSSGIIVSTGLGSTGWFRSIRAGAAAVSAFAVGGKAKKNKTPEALPWDTDHLQFAVREPFPSRATGTALACGRVTASDPLTVVSHMPENGVIFSDGIEQDYLSFNSGMEATITLAETKGRLVV